jgi:hypothetical protein
MRREGDGSGGGGEWSVRNKCLGPRLFHTVLGSSLCPQSPTCPSFHIAVTRQRPLLSPLRRPPPAFSRPSFLSSSHLLPAPLLDEGREFVVLDKLGGQGRRGRNPPVRHALSTFQGTGGAIVLDLLAYSQDSVGQGRQGGDGRGKAVKQKETCPSHPSS